MGRKREKTVNVQVGGFKPLAKLPPAPSTLGHLGKKRWREIGGELVRLSAIAKGDLLFLEQLCRLYDQQVELDALIATEGYTTPEGKINPLVTQRNRTVNKITDLLKACAMSPTHHTEIRPLADKEVEEKNQAANSLKVFNAKRTG